MIKTKEMESTKANRKILLISLLTLIIGTETFAQETGFIKGKITEQSTKRPLMGATISLKNGQQTTTTDSDGVFILSHLVPGTYSIIVTFIGFQPKIIDDITVAANKIYYLDAELLEGASDLGEVVIKKFRGENNPMLPVSSYSFSREEIFRNPGAQGDIFRAIGILPGVVSSGAQYSAIAVRGQGTSDNIYMVDDIPVFQVSHLEIEGFNAGFNDPNGGRFSIFAPRVIESALFEGGGFAAQYGRRSSSILNLNIKEGSKGTPYYGGQFDLIGFTLIYDGPSYINKKTTLFATARYQNFYLLERLVDLKGAGAPSYGDYLIKTTTELNTRNKLSFIAMFNPELYIRTIEDIANSENLNDDNSSTFVGRSKTSKAVIGFNLRTLIGKSSYWRNILYYRNFDVNNNLGYATPIVDSTGNIVSVQNIAFENNLRHIKNEQNEFGYRSIFTGHNRNFNLTAGVDLARIAINYSRTLKRTDTLYTFRQNDIRQSPSQYYLVLQPDNFNSAFKDQANNVSGYVDLSFSVFRRLTLNPGIRYDYTGFAKTGTFSPRISGSLALDEKQSINFATGMFFQDPEYSDIAGQGQGHRLKTALTIQHILGYKIYFSYDLKLVVEGWYKRFDNQTVRPFSGQPFLNNNGTGEAYGTDVTLTKRLTKKFYGQISYSYMQSKRDDHDMLGKYEYTFSQPHVVIVLGSLNFNKKWIFSGKFRYATGRPTDKYIVHNDIFNDPDKLNFSQEITGKNDERLSDFVSLDLRADYKIQRAKISWTLFMDVVDVLNRFNQNAAIFQNLTGKTYSLGLAIFPTFGLRVDL